MDISPDVVGELQRRLRRVEGQVRGIQNMLAEERECRDVVTQIAAASKALEQVGFRLLAAGLTSCLQDPEQSEAEGYSGRRGRAALPQARLNQPRQRERYAMSAVAHADDTTFDREVLESDVPVGADAGSVSPTGVVRLG